MRSPRRVLVLLSLLLAPAVLAGCLGDATEPGGDDGSPVLGSGAFPWPTELPDPITGIEVLATVPDMPTAYQLWVEGDIAYVAGWTSGFYTVDVSDPSNPQVLASIPDHFGHDVQLYTADDGRRIAALASSAEGLHLIDVSDPREPQVLSVILTREQRLAALGEGANVHNIHIIPGTTLIYNSRSLDSPGFDIVDGADPENPVIVGEFGDATCHDIGFEVALDRAYCAAIRETQIWDISDPRAPTLVTRIHNPLVNIHHWAIPIRNGTVLMIGDEFNGATIPVSSCYGGVDNPVTGGTTTSPYGAIWFYDITDEMAPTPISYIGADELYTGDPAPCTAHFGEYVPERDVLVIGFLEQGVYVVDLADITAPRTIAFVDVGDAPDVAVHNGYAFSVGRGRGMEVLRFT